MVTAGWRWLWCCGGCDDIDGGAMERVVTRWRGRDGCGVGSAPVTTAGVPVPTASTPITTAGVSVSTVKPSTPLTTTILIEDEDLTIP
ncbi:hypothetical protein Tco_1556485 [Tanacetum coccineum]